MAKAQFPAEVGDRVEHTDSGKQGSVVSINDDLSLMVQFDNEVPEPVQLYPDDVTLLVD